MAKTSTSNVVQKLFADGRVEDCDEKMTLEQMQKFVGGYIEHCACIIPKRVMVVNENGLYTDLSDNDAATKLVRPGVLMAGKLRGNVLLIKSK